MLQDDGSILSSDKSFLNIHKQLFSRTRCLKIGLDIHLLPCFVCANSECSGWSALTRRPSRAFAGHSDAQHQFHMI